MNSKFKNIMGRLYWITGLSKSGKSTLANRLFLDLRTEKKIVMLDGDELRKVYGLSGHYSHQQRLKMAMRHARMCHLLTSQGFDVICATISLFDEVRAWNKKNQEDYIEILLSASRKTLAQRNGNHSQLNVVGNQFAMIVGQDILAEFPVSPDIELKNDGSDGIEPVYLQLKAYLNAKD